MPDKRNVQVQSLILKAQGGGEGDPYIVVDQSPFRVGRRPDNHAQIAQPDVSGLHAELRYDANGWLVVDHNSTNGTFVNGRRIAGQSMISVGDILHFATKGFQVVIERENSAPMATKVMENSYEIKGMLELVQIMNDQRTYPHFQPIVDLKTTQVVGWESLGRARASDGPISPASLFAIASQNNAETRLSQLFRNSARFCAECRHCWPAEKGSYMFLNLHPAELANQTSFVEMMQELGRSELRRYYRIVIEIPEKWVGKTQEMQVLVKEIRKRGMLVAYDDFGIGQSRIPDLINVPPDFVKLDRSLVESLGSQRVKANLFKAIVDACRDLKVKTIGEGIETDEELKACIDLGVDLGQGYLLFKPKSAYELFAVDRKTLPDNCSFVTLNLVDRS